MSDDPRFERRARAWLEDGPTEAPERVLEAVFRDIRTTPQERGWHASRRRLTIMSVPLGIAAAIAAAIIAVPVVVPRSQVGDADRQAPPLACADGTTPGSGTIVTVAGGGSRPLADGTPARLANLTNAGVAIAPDGALILTDAASATIWRVGADGVLRTFLAPPAGTLEGPAGIVFDAAGDLYVTDPAANRIWKLDPAGAVSLVAGTGTIGSTGNDGPAVDATLANPSTIGIGSDGSVYVDDHYNYRRVDPAGTIHAFAGTGDLGFTGDGGPAVDASFGLSVLGIAGDQLGNVYLGDPGNRRVRKVDPAGVISTFAGTGAIGDRGDDGRAVAATLWSPVALAVGQDGAVFIADDSDETVRRVDPDGTITTIAGIGLPSSEGRPNGDCGPAVAAILSNPASLALGDGRVYVGERDGRIRAVVP